MTRIQPELPCTQSLGHADWSFALLGYLTASDIPQVREELRQALEYARRDFPLPAVAIGRLEELRVRRDIERGA